VGNTSRRRPPPTVSIMEASSAWAEPVAVYACELGAMWWLPRKTSFGS
jgi:hypothetical protein